MREASVFTHRDQTDKYDATAAAVKNGRRCFCFASRFKMQKFVFFQKTHVTNHTCTMKLETHEGGTASEVFVHLKPEPRNQAQSGGAKSVCTVHFVTGNTACQWKFVAVPHDVNGISLALPPAQIPGTSPRARTRPGEMGLLRVCGCAQVSIVPFGLQLTGPDHSSSSGERSQSFLSPLTRLHDLVILVWFEWFYLYIYLSSRLEALISGWGSICTHT